MSDPTVVYIMGYGRSGSTLLDAILASHEEIVSVGAAINLPVWSAEGQRCACGRRVERCDFWCDVLERYRRTTGSTDLQVLARCQHRIERRPAYETDDEDAQLYGRHLRALFESVAEASGRSTIVDSSKSAGDAIGRPYALARHAGLNVKPLYLARDARGVMWSGMRGPGSPERGASQLPRWLVGLKTLASWMYTNYRCARLLDEMPGTALPVRYEDLMSRTREELLRIGSFIDVDLGKVARSVSRGEGINTGHNLGGNRLRFREEIRIAPDFEWRSELPLLHRAAYQSLARWVAARMPHERLVDQPGSTREGTV